MFVVAAGAVDHESFVRQVEERFSSLPTKAVRAARSSELARYTGGDVREDRDLMDAQVLLGFEGKAYHARDFYCSQILANILGGGMSSRLFQEVREHRGLCYSVYAFHWGFSDTGIFGIHAATGGENLPELMPVIIDELRKSSHEHRAAGNRPRPRPDPRAVADGAGKPGRARRPDRPPDDALRPADPQRGD